MSVRAWVGTSLLAAFLLPVTAQELIPSGSTVKLDGADAEKKVQIAGRIAGPFSELTETDDSQRPYKAFHVRVGKTINITGDDGHCGDQEVTSLPISQFGMQKYLGKAVVVTATLSCHPKLGKFHLTDAIVNPL